MQKRVTADRSGHAAVFVHAAGFLRAACTSNLAAGLSELQVYAAAPSIKPSAALQRCGTLAARSRDRPEQLQLRKVEHSEREGPDLAHATIMHERRVLLWMC